MYTSLVISKAPERIMPKEASIPCGNKTLPKVPVFFVLMGGTTTGLLNVWSNVANTAPLEPASLTMRSMVSSIGSGFVTIYPR
jgi:hypothetical protein